MLWKLVIPSDFQWIDENIFNATAVSEIVPINTKQTLWTLIPSLANPLKTHVRLLLIVGLANSGKHVHPICQKVKRNIAWKTKINANFAMTTTIATGTMKWMEQRKNQI